MLFKDRVTMNCDLSLAFARQFGGKAHLSLRQGRQVYKVFSETMSAPDQAAKQQRAAVFQKS